MSRQARFQPTLQRLVLIAYKALDFGDASAAEALTAAAINDGAVSDKLLCAWRAGGEHVSEMPVGALAAILDHAGDKVGRVLNAICRHYGYEAVRCKSGVAGRIESIHQLTAEVGAEFGDLCRLGSATPERLAKEARELLEAAQRLVDAADAAVIADKGPGFTFGNRADLEAK